MKHTTAPPPAQSLLQTLYRLNDHNLFHPISVHVPNGMVPVAGLFMAMGCLFRVQALVSAAYLNLGVIFLAMPAVIATGFASWQHRYRGARTPLFTTKLACAALVFVFSGLILAFQTLYPVDVQHLTPRDWWVVAFYLLLLIPTIRAGFLGGKLVFASRNKPKSKSPAAKG